MLMVEPLGHVPGKTLNGAPVVLAIGEFLNKRPRVRQLLYWRLDSL